MSASEFVAEGREVVESLRHVPGGIGWEIDVVRSLVGRLNDMEVTLARVAKEGRLECVVAGKKLDNGDTAPICPEIVSKPSGMCAGCAARLLIPDSSETEEEG